MKQAAQILENDCTILRPQFIVTYKYIWNNIVLSVTEIFMCFDNMFVDIFLKSAIVYINESSFF